jgi:hypothetical protein
VDSGARPPVFKGCGQTTDPAAPQSYRLFRGEIIMHTPNFKAAVVLTLLGLPYLAAAATSEPLGVEPDTLATIAKEKTKKQFESKGKRDGDSGDNENGCGNIDIGNFLSNGKSSRAPKEITVIITGDVVSVDNKCK